MMEIAMIILLLFIFGVAGIMIAGMWKIFQKAGYEGWECIVPIYNLVIFYRIVGKPWWWLLLLCIPVVNYVFLIWSYNMLSKSFGKDEGYTAGIVFLGFIFIPLLGFGPADYEGPYGDPIAFREYRDRNKGGFDFESNQLA